MQTPAKFLGMVRVWKDGEQWPTFIDLRLGDQIMWHKHWRTIERVAVCRDAWLTETEAMACEEAGYIYRPSKRRANR
jgi:hypothetical protein